VFQIASALEADQRWNQWHHGKAQLLFLVSIGFSTFTIVPYRICRRNPPADPCGSTRSAQTARLPPAWLAHAGEIVLMAAVVPFVGPLFALVISFPIIGSTFIIPP